MTRKPFNLSFELRWLFNLNLCCSYGFHVSHNSYFLGYVAEDIKNMFERLRHYDGTSGDEFTVNEIFQIISNIYFYNYLSNKYPTKCGPYKINKVRDLTVGLVIDYKNNGERSTPVIDFFFNYKLKS